MNLLSRGCFVRFLFCWAYWTSYHFDLRGGDEDGGSFGVSEGVGESGEELHRFHHRRRGDVHDDGRRRRRLRFGLGDRV